jgi:putative resolvase
MATIVGYARISTGNQRLDMQLDALTASGCTRIHTDTASGALAARPGLDQALAELDEGDTLVVWRLDRLGRFLSHLVATIDNLTRRGINLRSLHEAIDTTTPTGRLMVHLIASLAEFERELTIERTIAGLEAAKARGANLGSPTVWAPQRAEAAETLLAAGATVTQAAAALGVSRATIYRHANPPKTTQSSTRNDTPTY